jgi:hypothetical protein
MELEVPVLGPLRQRWRAEIVAAEAGSFFRDHQRRGPFTAFEHTHRFETAGPRASVMEDRIRYELPGGALGSLFGSGIARARLESTFAYRHRVLREDLLRHGDEPAEKPLRVLISGTSGLIGRALFAFLSTAGHEVVRLVRDATGRGSAGEGAAIVFDPRAGAVRPSELEGFDAVIHLAGAGIADRRWTERRKREIRDSRVIFTRRLSETIGALRHPPRVFISSSAIGIYGDRGDRILRESDPPGADFLSEVGALWEAATEPAEASSIRVVRLRTGIVLTPAGGALKPMLPAFRLGLGGPVGHGTQWWSWIALDDLLYLILHALRSERLAGAVNATSPEAATSRDFASTLGRALGRPAFIPAPAPALRLALGEMAGPLLFASARVAPERALDSGFRFSYPRLETALRHCLGRLPAPEAAESRDDGAAPAR